MRHSGFTLIEVLIAMSIFAVVSVITFQGIRSSMMVQERTVDHAEDLTEMQLVWTVLFQDFANMTRRPVREEGRDEPHPAFDLDPDDESDCVVGFTRAGLPSSSALPAGMQRLAYCVRDGDLYRLVWPVLDRARDTLAQESLLMEDVYDFIVEPYPRTFDPEGEKEAPVDDAGQADDIDDCGGSSVAREAFDKIYELPVGVVVTIETDGQTFVRWFPGGAECRLEEPDDADDV